MDSSTFEHYYKIYRFVKAILLAAALSQGIFIIQLLLTKKNIFVFLIVVNSFVISGAVQGQSAVQRKLARILFEEAKLSS